MPEDEGLKPCLVIAPIGEDNTPERKRSDQTLTHIVKPVCKECGFEAIRADEISDPGIITTQVIQRLLDDDLVVADLTGHNANVMYELAIRHAAHKPVVQLMGGSEKLPFDVVTSRTVFFDLTDPDSLVAAKTKLGEQIRSALTDPDAVDSPLTSATLLRALQQSSDPAEKGSAEIIGSLHEILARLTALEGVRRPVSLAGVTWDDLRRGTTLTVRELAVCVTAIDVMASNVDAAQAAALRTVSAHLSHLLRSTDAADYDMTGRQWMEDVDRLARTLMVGTHNRLVDAQSGERTVDISELEREQGVDIEDEEETGNNAPADSQSPTPDHD